MPFMKQGQPWLYDETTGDVVGVKDPDGSERFFLSRRKTEVAWVNLSTPITLTANTNYNMVALFKAITDIPQRGSLAPFFNTATNKLNVYNEGATLTFKLNMEGSWSGPGSTGSMELKFLGTVGNNISTARVDGQTSDIISLPTFFSIDADDYIALNGTEPILRANSRSFTIDSILLIAEQDTHLPNISAI
jgi:hypothetical protein